MRITKEFKFEGSHVVRNCSSHRCSHSVHGHSYRVLVTLSGRKLDNAGMLLDFGLLKGPVKEFIDSMDHCHLICAYDDKEYVDFFTKHNERWILIPFNPSAEMIAIWIHRFVRIAIENMAFTNHEDINMKVESVRVYETATGSAESCEDDIKYNWTDMWIPTICFSEGVTKDWSKETKEIFLEDKLISNKKVKQQILIPGFNTERELLPNN